VQPSRLSLSLFSDRNQKTAAREATSGQRRTGARESGDATAQDRLKLPLWLLIDVGLIALTLAVYGQAWDFDFIAFDDPACVADNVHVTSGLSLAGVSWAFRTFYEANWIPLTWISLMADTSLYGGWRGGYHITNVLLHVANVLLLFHFLRRATDRVGPSAVVAALFAVHPIHAESVAWVTERKDVLSMFFGLWSLLFYVHYARGRSYLALALSLMGMGASLLAKQTFVTLPFVFLLLDFWPLTRFGREKLASLLLEKAPFFLLIPIVAAMTIAAQTSHAATAAVAASPVLRLANALDAYLEYLGKAIYPLFLGILYPFQTDINLVSVGLAVAVIVAITYGVVRLRERLPFLLVGWLWFLGTLVPMIGIVRVGRQQMADRYAYLPFIGLYVAVVWLAATLIPSRWLKASLAAAAIAFYAVIGYVQVGYWRDGLVLAQHSCAVARDNWFCHYLLGIELNGAGHPDEAIAEMRAGIRVEPHEPEPYIRLGDFLIRMGRDAEAARAYRGALANRDDSVDAIAGLGWTYLRKKDYVAAKRQFARALEIDPRLANLHFYMAYVCRLMGDYDESARLCRTALKLDSEMAPTKRLLADDLDSLGQTSEAAEIRKSLPQLSSSAAGSANANPSTPFGALDGDQ
jgi:tetratricopeptide (TPR) repeat protein